MWETDRKTNPGVGVLWDLWETCGGIQLTEWFFPHSSWSGAGGDRNSRRRRRGGGTDHIYHPTPCEMLVLYRPSCTCAKVDIAFFSFPFVVYYRILTIVPCAIQ